MKPKERILSIQLIQKLEKNPSLAKKLDIEFQTNKAFSSKVQTKSK